MKIEELMSLLEGHDKKLQVIFEWSEDPNASYSVDLVVDMDDGFCRLISVEPHPSKER
jgi:hypothetical protein